MPDEVAKFAFGDNVNASDIMTFENTWKLFISSNFPHKSKFNSILKRFSGYLIATKVPIPTEVTLNFPNLIKKYEIMMLKYNQFVNNLMISNLCDHVFKHTEMT